MAADGLVQDRPGSTLGFAWTLARAFPRQSVVASGCLLLASLAEGVGIVSLVPLIGMVSGHGGESTTHLAQYVHRLMVATGFPITIPAVLVLIVLMMFAKAGLSLFAMKQTGYAVALVETDLRLSLIRALMKARWEHFISRREGALTNAVTLEAERSAQGYLRACRIVAHSFQVAVYVALSMLASWQLTLAAVILSSFGVMFLGKFVEMSRAAGIRQIELLKSVSVRLVEVLRCIKPLKAMACENAVGPFLEADARELNKARQKEVLSHEARFALYEPTLAVLIALGFYAAATIWKTDLETVMLLALLFYRALGRVNSVQGEYQDLARIQAAHRSLRSAIDQAEAQAETLSGGNKPRLTRAINFRDVHFSYGPADVLENVSLKIPAGRFTTVMGPSGAGKTTLADLMAGLIRPQQGDVYVDDEPLGELDLKAWRSMIGYVPQETILFHDSVYENIVLGRLDLSVEDAEAALKLAGAWDFVCELPNGIRTVVGERGSKLSGGQRQRISLARALVRRPAVLILDEVTSALDPESEAAICTTLTRLKGAATIFAISHQKALVEASDVVYILDDGCVCTQQPGGTTIRHAVADGSAGVR